MTKVCSAEEAVRSIRSGSTIVVDGSGAGVNEPYALLRAAEARFLAEGAPSSLTVVHVSGMGDRQGGGIDRFAHPGMVKRVIGGHWGWTPRMQAMAAAEEIEAYCLPQGTISHLMREIAARRPGTISSVGIDTFVDPRLGGGRLNATATDDIVELISIGGREYILTPSFPVHVAMIRATVADSDGNLVMDGEGLLAETLAVAQAARNSGGMVLAQVRDLVETGTLDPRRVRVPGILVDAIVVEPDQPLSSFLDRNPYLTGELRAPAAAQTAMPQSVRKVIARRAASEIREGDIINLGYGMPDGVASVLAEEGHHDSVTLTVEQGHIGGIPALGNEFGMAINPAASLDAGAQFDWYDGGGLDVAVLSFAEIDAFGNVNVSSFNGRMPGIGGFVNISQGASRVVFVGTFVVGPGPYHLGEEGTISVPGSGQKKFVSTVSQISFSARRSLEAGQTVNYVTERAVFALRPTGVELIEVAPGLDLERDILAHMDFDPAISAELKVMSPSLFRSARMNLKLASRKDPSA